MNYYTRIFTLKQNSSPAIFLYGYALPDKENEVRGWTSGKIGKRLHLYQLTCVMCEQEFAEFECRIVEQKEVALGEDFMVRGEFIKRPDVIRYPKRGFFGKSESLLKSLCTVREYWNLNKVLLFQEMAHVYDSLDAKRQRGCVHDVLRALSDETGISFLQEAGERLGNFEVYLPSPYQNSFEWEMQKEDIFEKMHTGTRTVCIKKKGLVEEDFWISCVLSNADRCILHQMLEWNADTPEVYFSAEEVVSEVQISIWRQSDGRLIYFDEGCLVRQFVLTTHMMSNTRYIVNDSWTAYLEKTFGGSQKKQEKLDAVKEIKRQYAPMVSRIGGYKEDPWHEAGKTARRLAGSYQQKHGNGAFCKKVGAGDCEIDSFCKVADYLNARGVERAILVDPYFSIRSMEKLLSRIVNQKLRLEVVTSLNNIDPDKEGDDAVQPDYMEQVRKFLRTNSDMIHQHLKIVNVTQNGKTAIHDRYILRLMEDGTIDGYLLSNSLNAAGKYYNFVVAQMDQDVAYEVLDYVHEITDAQIQAKRNKEERLGIEILWDTLEHKYEKEVTAIVPCKNWEIKMKDAHEKGVKWRMEDFFAEGWCVTEECAKEAVSRLCWYMYYSNELDVSMTVSWMREQGIDLEYIAELCSSLATEWEAEEALYEAQDRNRSASECYKLRCALDITKQDQIKMNAGYIMQDFFHIYYPANGFVKCMYQLLFEISSYKLVWLMQEIHAPLAFEVLLENMLGQAYRIDIYDALLESEISWLSELAYHYFARVFMQRLEEGAELWDEEMLSYLEEHREYALYQYACWEQNISFTLKYNKRQSGISMKRELLIETEKACRTKIAKLLDEGLSFDKTKFWALYNGSNEGVNAVRVCYLWDCVTKTWCKEWLEEKVIEQLRKYWRKKRQFLSDTDAEVTHAAAYMAYQRWGTAVDTVLNEMKMTYKELYTALRPGIRDIDYNTWSQSVDAALWHLLFLQYYLELWDEEEVQTKAYEQVKEHMQQLARVKGQCEWKSIEEFLY